MHSEIERRQIAELIAALLTHYWTGDDDPATRRRQAADWLEDLEEFSVTAIHTAIKKWRREWAKRPTPADIIALARDARDDETVNNPSRLLPSASHSFPSRQHQAALVAKMKTTKGLEKERLCEQEKREYHAYDYATRHRFGFATPSPIDPNRQYYDAELVARATRSAG